LSVDSCARSRVASCASRCWPANCRAICEVPPAWARRLPITASKKCSICRAPSCWAAAVLSDAVLYAATRASVNPGPALFILCLLLIVHSALPPVTSCPYGPLVPFKAPGSRAP
jgi:hypothetical protein